MVLVILVSIAAPLILFPDQGQAWVSTARGFVVDNLGFAYLAFGVLSMLFFFYVVFSDIGKIRASGRPEETANLKTPHGPRCCFVAVLAPVFCIGDLLSGLTIIKVHRLE